MKSNLGLLGGTFDPVHRGHLELARYAMDLCNLAGVVFIPAFYPPHKINENITPFNHRVEMLNLAVAEDKRLSVSKIEQHISPPTYTVDMLEYLYETSQESANYYFIIGIDAFLEITSWKNYMKVLASTHFIVSARKGYTLELLHNFLKSLNYTRYGQHWETKSHNYRIFYLDIDIIDVSSSEIRQKIIGCTAQCNVLLDSVQQYIKAHNLYIRRAMQ